MSLLEPIFLTLGVAAILFWVGPWRARSPKHGLLRTFILLTVVLALAQPVWKRTSSALHRVFVVDRSPSLAMDPATQYVGNLNEAFAKSSNETWTLLELGGSKGVPLATSDGLRHEILAGDSGPSNLDTALSWAAAAIPQGEAGGVVLMSDGLSTDGFPTRAASELWAKGIPLSMVPMGAIEGDLRAVRLEPTGDSIAYARVGTPCEMVATLEGAGQVVACLLVDVTQPTQPIELARIENIRVDGTHGVPLSFEPSQPGFLEIEFRVLLDSGQDARTGDLVLSRTLAVQDPLRVAYMGERVQGAAESFASLVGPGFELIEDPQGVSLDRADLVILDDRPADSVPQSLQERIVEAVTQGGMGLLATGGEAAFGPGGYHNQPLESLLPVEMVQKEEKRDPSSSLVLIIDTSGSMGGNRVQLAKQVSRLAIRRLLPHDKVGIVEFYGAKRWAVPLQPASNSIEIERALNRLDAGGGTVILPAIEEAYYGLKNVRTRYKHVLILTDGGVETGAFEPLLRRMSDDGINVSTVLIGPDAHSEFLVNIANWGQGRFYSVPNRFNLPEILLKQPASAKLPAYRPGVTQVSVHGGRGWWGELDASQVPPVSGYVETRLRPGAEKLIETSSERHPVLASWRFGLGRVSAMTTEPTGPGTESWQKWNGYGALLGRMCLRTADDGAQPFAFALHRDGSQVTVVAERRRPGTSVPFAKPVSENAAEFTFQQVAPNRWEARVLADPSQDLRLFAGAQGSSRAPLRLVLNPISGGAHELQVPSTVGTEVQALANSLGGAVLDGWPSGVNAFPVSSKVSSKDSLRLAPWLALLAMLMYLCDLLYRRLPRSQS